MASIVVYITDSKKIETRPLPESFKNDWIPGARIKTPDGKEFCKILRIEDDDEKTIIAPAKQPVSQSKTMLRLSKYDVERKAILVSKLNDLETRTKAFVDEYNEIICAVNEFVEDIVQRQQDYFDDRSESWQESDRGDEYDSWKSEWENFSSLEEMECPDMEFGELEELPNSMD